MKPTAPLRPVDRPAHSPHGVGRPTASGLLRSFFERLRRDPDDVTLTVALTFLSLLPKPPPDPPD